MSQVRDTRSTPHFLNLWFPRRLCSEQPHLKHHPVRRAVSREGSPKQAEEGTTCSGLMERGESYSLKSESSSFLARLEVDESG